MSSIIQSRPGVVKLLLKNASSAPGTLVTFQDGGPGGKGGGNGGFRTTLPVTITGIGYSQSVNIQFMPTLRKMVYVYAFGDRMGSIKISGLAFDNQCPISQKKSGWGTRELFDYYDKNRAVKDGQLIGINIAGRPIQGFLIGMDLSLASLEFKTMGFVMNIATLPKNQASNQAGT